MWLQNGHSWQHYSIHLYITITNMFAYNCRKGILNSLKNKKNMSSKQKSFQNLLQKWAHSDGEYFWSEALPQKGW